MRINFLCPSCENENIFETGVDEPDFACEHCSSRLQLKVSDSIRSQRIIDSCIVCGKELFFIQKDFNRTLGCVILTVGAVASVYTYGLSLLVAAALDWFLYKRLPEVTVCYVCNSIYRGYAPNPAHGGFDLSIGELVEGSVRGER